MSGAPTSPLLFFGGALHASFKGKSRSTTGKLPNPLAQMRSRREAIEYWLLEIDH